MLFISPIFLYLSLNKDILEKKSFWTVLGFRSEGLLQAFVMPLFLTMILHLGPLALLVHNGLLKLYTEPMYWVNNVKDLIWLRSQIVAPISEEFSFRSCMLPVLLQCFSPIKAVFICPIFFGAAHFHHLLEKLKNNVPVKFAVIESCVQFIYTTIFGVYSAYLFYRTGHFISIFIAHSFCNHMGVPDFEEFMRYKGTEKYVIGSLFVIGLVSWCFLLNPLTEPKWYYND
ncbi:PREDICTED: CAAX prenyl protease 2 isoform X2 [Nicrophorus vespilloides]|nr:PREDICTED: CAAX prenyl protease 2 isoform X2 [Nicrophorus vespilloides]